MFKAWDAFDLEGLGTYWHDDIAMNIVGLPDRESALRITGKDAALEFVRGVKEQLTAVPKEVPQHHAVD